MIINDAHCHFFSPNFFAGLGAGLPDVHVADAADAVVARLGWDAPGDATALADRWVAELDRHQVRRAALIASVPGDEASVGIAVARHPSRFVGFFMVDPTKPGAHARAAHALDEQRLRAICLFPAMHRYNLHDDGTRRIFEVAATHPGTVVFVHCGVLSIGARRKLGLASPFDVSRGDPLHLHSLALDFPSVPIVVPHFGAGLFRETLMLADLCPNILLDTSSSNAWMKYEGLTLAAVFRRALTVVGAERLLFGTDSSFFPRGWVADVFAAQRAALDEAEVSEDAQSQIFGGNFDRLFAP